MPRTLVFCCVAVAAFADPCLAEQTTANSEMLIRLNVRPEPAPKPALRYRLLPELKEMNPGNPIQSYMKCMMEQKKFFFDEEAFQNREKLLTMPLKELPAQELKEDGRYALSRGRPGGPARQSRLAGSAEAEGPTGSSCCFPKCSRSAPWPGPFRCGFGPRSPSADLTTRSEPPRRCSPSRAT